jgi:hypothetical protein
MQLNIATQIPTDINTVEQLAVWAILLLDDQAGLIQIKEEENLLPVYAAQAQIVRVADKTKRLIGRVSIEMEDDYDTNTSVKLWKRVKELVTTQIPINYTTN